MNSKTPTYEGHKVPFHPGMRFHVFNRTNNKENLFFDNLDRHRFFRSYQYFIEPYFKTYAFCLLENHFHFIIEVLPKELIVDGCKLEANWRKSRLQKEFLKVPDSQGVMSKMLTFQFARFFNSYARYFNTKYSRKGNLFYRSFKRVLITDEQHHMDAICYVHTNPLKHFGMKNFGDYPWSSCDLSKEKDFPIKLEINEVIKVFGSKKAYKKAHMNWANRYNLSPGD
ncbi:MAG: hypothetical protein GYB31_03465 [Bacteroidetes bacterium]|nr:hypothetical protein [Bacteroidota bacterium]